jgi:hypothetical protein
MTKRIPNIGPEGHKTRLRGGLIALVVGIAGGAILVWSGIDPWWRLVLFFPFWQGALGVFQALNKT